MTKAITLIDRAFWITETDQNPKHVGGIQILSLPEHISQEYVYQLYRHLKTFSTPTSPFSCKIKTYLGFPTHFEDVDKLDMDYHLHFHQIHDVSNSTELHQYVARLHEVRLDKDKPLWQYHLIQSHEGNQWAIYIKIHHMYGDGASLLQWFQTTFSSQPNQALPTPVWSIEHPERPKKYLNQWTRFLHKSWIFIHSFMDIFWMFCRLFLKLIRLNRHYMPLPFSGKKTVLTGQVKKGRTLVTTDLPLDRVQHLSKKLRATVNELLLTTLDIALHRLLNDYGHTFDKPFIAQMPINLRKPGEKTTGNKIGIALVELAYAKKDPYLRLRQIIQSHKIVKDAAKKVTPSAFSYYTLILQSYAILFEALRLSDYINPLGNILISNMPGPKQQLYFQESAVVATYPISTIPPGGGINVTMLTYNGRVNVGMVCCNRDIKSLAPMKAYLHEAFDLLERSVDDHRVTTDDIGEVPPPDGKSVVDDPSNIVHQDDSKEKSAA
ncbi:wax ester/triacylglycerol synthase domain-containing protein [Algicola sagamiensis]|uniref:wax ester/triacylglycerol synthase domain-containing protein n=1 Tax=Algicola sagamiensis TaxID=163869 RepID=UPI00036B86FB|nr:wax ester/triacylglycerol synthase domain-containing protein [Algicola sagamiensis]